MVVIGIDAHKRTHTAVAVDDVGCQLAHTTVKATSAGHLALRRCASRWSQRRVAVEDCRHLTRRLESDLLAVGEAVTRVPVAADGCRAPWRAPARQVGPDRRAGGGASGAA
jgi:transposase